MRIHRVFVPKLEPVVTLTGREAHHLAQVLRVRAGQAIRAFDGRGFEADGTVTTVEAMQIKLELNPAQASSVEAVLSISLAVALLKGDKLAEVIRMATELGIVAFRPFISQHCAVTAMSENKLERLRRIAREAAKQSGRSLVPDIHEPINLAQLPLEPLTLLTHPYSQLSLQDLELSSPLMVITGPEGGFSESEVQVLQECGAQAVRLGKRILRAETAPIALISALLVPEAL
jgi:16S rRNA (uracil1498-N3)-methyltransferase